MQPTVIKQFAVDPFLVLRHPALQKLEGVLAALGSHDQRQGLPILANTRAHTRFTTIGHLER